MRYLTTGGTGYIGGEFVRLLLKSGHEVANIGRRNHSISKVKSFILEEGVEAKSIRVFSPDIIVHFAACFDNSNIEQIVDVNVTLPLKLLDLIKNTDTRFFYIGSYWQFGDQSATGVPIDLYSAAKQSFDSFLKFYSRYYSVKCASIILYGSFGERDARGKILDYILDCASDGRVAELSPGDQKLNLLHVYEIASEIYRLVNFDDLEKNCYSIRSSKEWTVKDIVEYVLQIKPEFVCNLGRKAYRFVELMDPIYVGDCTVLSDQVEKYIEARLDEKK